MSLARSQKRKFNNLFIYSCSLVLLAAAVAEGAIKRTTSGLPDLTGTYDVATLTPFERPVAFGENLYLTREEAEKISEEERLRVETSSQASDPTREAPPDGGDGSPGAAVRPFFGSTTIEVRNLPGYWKKTRWSPRKAEATDEFNELATHI
ncbi:MAG: hypothetical protein O7E57_04370, partial [Gammaproteobacteria bacterium]|nr:hypothetical protein [Gammaproteobacteria bacterium]